MAKFLKRLFCSHHYNLIYIWTHTFGGPLTKPWYVDECGKCGKVKTNIEDPARIQEILSKRSRHNKPKYTDNDTAKGHS